MEIVGYIAAMCMGLSLGLIGGGGSILTVPILVYLFGMNPIIGTAYSLLIVGLTSAVGSISHFRQGNVDFQAALLFGVPSIFGVYAVRKFVVPYIQDPVCSMGEFDVSKSLAVLVVFALLMLLASVSMIRQPKEETQVQATVEFRYLLIVVVGLLTGGITSLVGAGGGFLIIPALVFLIGLPMKRAVGTSLFIIALKSLIGFMGDLDAGTILDWRFLVSFSIFAAAGITIGSYLTKSISNEKLKPAFGWFVMMMGFGILGKELLF